MQYPKHASGPFRAASWLSMKANSDSVSSMIKSLLRLSISENMRLRSGLSGVKALMSKVVLAPPR